MRQEITSAAAKAAPPIGVAVWNTLSTIPAEKWLTYLTIFYVGLQAFMLLRKEFFKRRRSGRKAAK